MLRLRSSGAGSSSDLGGSVGQRVTLKVEAGLDPWVLSGAPDIVVMVIGATRPESSARTARLGRLQRTSREARADRTCTPTVRLRVGNVRC